jgi:hypothetical protein
MATERNISLFESLANPSTNARVLAYDPDQPTASERTRLIPILSIMQGSILIVSGDPNGVTSAVGPAVGISEDGDLWVRPVATPGNTGWIHMIAS